MQVNVSDCSQSTHKLDNLWSLSLQKGRKLILLKDSNGDSFYLKYHLNGDNLLNQTPVPFTVKCLSIWNTLK